MTLYDLYLAWVERRDCPAYRAAEKAGYPFLDQLPDGDAQQLVETIIDREAAAYAAGFKQAAQLLQN